MATQEQGGKTVFPPTEGTTWAHQPELQPPPPPPPPPRVPPHQPPQPKEAVQEMGESNQDEADGSARSTSPPTATRRGEPGPRRRLQVQLVGPGCGRLRQHAPAELPKLGLPSPAADGQRELKRLASAVDELSSRLGQPERSWPERSWPERSLVILLLASAVLVTVSVLALLGVILLLWMHAATPRFNPS